MDLTKAPDWWLTRPGEIRDFLESLDGVEVEEIGRSAGGRPLIAAAWGERQELPGQTSSSLASAVAGGKPSAFFGEGRRERQVLMFVGAAHGTEVEGTVAALNLLNVLVTGNDLRGRAWPAIAEHGRRQRFAIIPILNVDGRERVGDEVSWIGCDLDYHSMIAQGRRRDGEILTWPTSKLAYPLPLDEMDVVGSYFNDAGVNLVYDTNVADCQPETKALLDYCAREHPDGVLLSHSNSGTQVHPSAYLPRLYQQRVDHFGAVVGQRCARERFHLAKVTRGPETSGDPFYQSDMVHHACGALPLIVEFPWGYKNVPDNHDDILDFGLTVLEEILCFADHFGYRPDGA